MCHMNDSCQKSIVTQQSCRGLTLKQHKLVLDLATSPETISTGSTKKRHPPKVEENGYEPVVFLVVLESECQAKMNVYIICHFLLMGSFSQVQLDQVLEVIHDSYSIALISLHMTNSKVMYLNKRGEHLKQLQMYPFTVHIRGPLQVTYS